MTASPLVRSSRHSLLVLLMMFYVCSTAAAAMADDDINCEPEQVAKLLASDGASNDWLGYSVAISGTTALVGASLDDDNGSNSGSAYIFEQQPDGSWLETAKLLASDGASTDFFGNSVAISGTIALVGAYRGDGNETNSGSAYIFEQQPDGSWLETAKLLASDGESSDYFGYSVAISETTVLIGAYEDGDNGSNSGSGYIFEQQQDGTWLETAKLTASDGASNDRLGYSVANSGTTALVGACYDDDNGLNSGSAYIFEQQQDGSWLETAKLLASDGESNDWFGWSVAISGTIDLVGAYGDDDNGSYSGSAYIFKQQQDSSWLETAKLLAADGESTDYFGYSVAISGTTALVGAYADDDNGGNSGSASIFNIPDLIDCNENGICDIDDIAFGTSEDTNGNGIPDECECPDTNGDGTINVNDILAVIGGWDDCVPDADCPADVDGDGTVGVNDLLLVIGEWGECL